jgi:hypothetical protein
VAQLYPRALSSFSSPLITRSYGGGIRTAPARGWLPTRLLSSLCNLSTERTENLLFIRCCGKVFIKSLPSNDSVSHHVTMFILYSLYFHRPRYWLGIDACCTYKCYHFYHRVWEFNVLVSLVTTKHWGFPWKCKSRHILEPHIFVVRYFLHISGILWHLRQFIGTYIV